MNITLKASIAIKGLPYSVTWVPPGPTVLNGGWTVVCMEKRTDRLYRNYFVRSNEEHKPVLCTCPAFAFSDPHMCKHITAIAELCSTIGIGK